MNNALKLRSQFLVLTLGSTLMASALFAASQQFISQGPAPSNSENGPANNVAGAIQGLAVNPGDPKTIFIGGVCGGIWRTTDGGTTWVPLTDHKASLSIANITYDPTDSSHKTLIAGIGLTGNGTAAYAGSLGLTSSGGARIGILYSQDGGNTWTLPAGNATLSGHSVPCVLARGNVLLAGTFEPLSFFRDTTLTGVGGLYRSTDNGATFTLNGSLPVGPVTSLAGAVSNPALIYAAITSSTTHQATAIYASSDTGATWGPTPIFGAAQSGGLISSASQTVIKITTGPSGSIAALIVDTSGGAGGKVAGVFLSQDSGSTWHQFDLTAVNNAGGFNPMDQGVVNSALIIDPSDPNTVYVTGTYILEGNRFDISAWSLKLSGSSTIATSISLGSDGNSVHPDSRSLAFDGPGRLLVTHDGGLSLRTQPGGNGIWTSLNGNLSLFQNYAAAYDANGNLVVVAAQDNDTTVQSAPNQPVFNWLRIGGDGTNAAINDHGAQSVYYASAQSLEGISRYTNSGATKTGLTLSGTSSSDWHFFSPLVLNRIDPTLMAFGGITNVFIAQDNDFQSNTLTLTGLSPVATTIFCMAYGTKDNTGALLAGGRTAGAGSVLLSTAAMPSAGTLNRLSSYSGHTPVTLVFDGRTQNRFYIADGTNLWGTTDTGTTFTNLTANLPATFTTPYGVEFLSNNGVNALFIGGLNNTSTNVSPFAVADSDNSGNLSNWRSFGTDLPNSIANRISYNPKSDTLLVGTFGRGAWLMYDVTSNFPSATVLQFGLANNDSSPDPSILTGNRPLFKYGPGTLTIAGNATYTGLSTILAGRMTVNGTIPGDVLVDNGATLSGVGVIQGTVTVESGGTLSPGNSIGTITLGNLNLHAGSITNIEIDPSSASKVAVIGTATLGGNVHVTQDPGTYPSSGSYDILTAATLNGSFSPTVLGGLPGFHFALLQFPHLIRLIYNELISTSGLSGNAQTIADYLNNQAPNSAATKLLSSLTGDTLQNALNTISPARNAFATFAIDNMMFSFDRLIDNRFSSMRFKHCAEEETYSLWVDGFANFAHQNAQNQTPAFRFDSEGALIGLDYNGVENGLVGTSAGYGKSHISEKHGFGKGNIYSYVLAGYGMTYIQNAYLEFSLFGTLNQIENRRHIFFPGFNAIASSSYNSYQLMPHVGVGYDIGSFWCIMEPFLVPFAKLDWVVNWVEGFKEHGASAFNMRQKRSTSSILRSEIGLQCYQNIGKNWGIFTLKETAAYVNKAPFHIGRVTAALVGIDSSFTVETLKRNQNLFSCGLDLLFEGNGGIFGSIEYAGEFGSGYTSNDIQVKFGKHF